MNTARIEMSSALATFAAVRDQLAEAACMVLDFSTDKEIVMTTADTITDDQIESLRAEAAAAGDLAQVSICSLALNMPPLLSSSAPQSHRDMNAGLREHARKARAECARVIADAAAQ
jgi:hypothetical protein